MEYNHVLLTGASGTLGEKIICINKAQKFLAPSRNILDIAKPETIKKFFNNNEIDAVIHCAAMARMKECQENPVVAIETNIIGTSNLVIEVLKKENKLKKNIRLVHISTDGVYPGANGNYSEKSETIPYNTYGWTKLGAECAVKTLKNYCIIRTNFFDPKDIKFDKYATDAYTSKVTVDYLAKAVIKMLESDFIGTINIGAERKSDFDNYKKYKESIKPCKLNDILKIAPFPRAQDSSMDCALWKKIENQDRIKFSQ